MANGVNESRGLTRTGVDATQLSSPDLGAASFSRAGVVDRSGEFAAQAKSIGLSSIAGAIEQSGQIALDADTGFAKASLEKDLREGVIQDFLNRRDPEFIEKQKAEFQDASTSLFALEQTQNALRSAEGEGAAIEQTAPDHAAVMERLKNSEAQGIMSRRELEMRVLKATREAIARRPGLADELTAHAERTLGLSGIREVASFEENLAQQEAQRLAAQSKLVVSEALKRGLSVDILNPDIPRLNVELQTLAREEQAFNSAKRIKEHRDLISAEEVADFVKNEGVPAIRGSFNEFVQNASTLFKDIEGEGDLSKRITQARNLADQYLANNEQMIFEAGVSGPEAKAMRELGKRMIDSWMDNIQEHATGGNVANITKNAYAIASNTNKLDMEVRYNPSEINLLTQVIGHLGTVFSNKPEIQDYLINLAGNLTQGRMGSKAMKDGTNQDNIKQGVPDVVSILMGGMKNHVMRDGESSTTPGGRVKDPTHFETMAVEFQNQLIDNPHGLSSEERFKLLKGLVTEFGGPETAGFFNNATSETKRAFTNMYDQYRIVLANQRDKIRRQAEDAGLNVAEEVMPDGRIQYKVSGGDEGSRGNIARVREFNNRMNNGVGNRLNELIQSSSVLFGNSFKEASELVRGKLARSNVTSSVGSEDLIDKIVQVESGGDPEAAPETSKALGLGQFVPATWNRMVDKFAPELKEGRTPEQVLELRKDPELSKRMIANLAEDNARILRDSDVDLSDTNIYLAHFLGAPSASMLLQESGNTKVEDVLPAKFIKANPSVLEGKTVAQVKQWAARKMGENP